MKKGKAQFVVQAGEEFEIHISGPNPNIADPTGLIGGTTFEFKAPEDRSDLKWIRAYTTDHEVGSQFLTRLKFDNILD